MKPLKNLVPLATWILRLALVFYLFASFTGIFMQFDFHSQWFYLSVINLFTGAILFAGGFIRQHQFTVFPALILFAAALYQLVFLLTPLQYLTHTELFMALAISLFFVSKGR